MVKKKIFLSYFINKDTPTYGNRNQVLLTKKSSIEKGDVANETHINSTLHVGTHIDLPNHFYSNGKTLEDYPPDFWFFNRPLFMEIDPVSLVVEKEVINILEQTANKAEFDIIIIKTGYCHIRESRKYWEENIGFSPAIYEYLMANCPNVRIIGFDSISVSSFQHRDTGRLAHKKFLNPNHPILLLEDMNLKVLNNQMNISSVIVAPLLIACTDGSPCNVIATVE